MLQFKRYDSKADLWSVGTILYELLVGRPPYNGANHVHLLRNIERSEARLPDNVAAQLSPECRSLIMSLLRRNPAERIGFKEFFDHPFLQPVNQPPPPLPLLLPEGVGAGRGGAGAPGVGVGPAFLSPFSLQEAAAPPPLLSSSSDAAAVIIATSEGGGEGSGSPVALQGAAAVAAIVPNAGYYGAQLDPQPPPPAGTHMRVQPLQLRQCSFAEAPLRPTEQAAVLPEEGVGGRRQVLEDSLDDDYVLVDSCESLPGSSSRAPGPALHQPVVPMEFDRQGGFFLVVWTWRVCGSSGGQ